MKPRHVTQDSNLADQVIWLDKESAAFVRNGRRVTVRVDFAPGFFSRGRIIHAASIAEWEATATSPARAVTDQERGEIISALAKFYRGWFKRPVTVVE